MSNIHQKAPLTRTLNAFAQQRALDEIQKTGRSLPGHVVAVDGALITVNFDVIGGTFPRVQMPLFGPVYLRYPIQPGDLGFAIAADATLSQVSGMGNSIADITYLRGNLATLAWLPIGNATWETVVSGLVCTSSAFTAEQNLSVGNGWTGTITDLTGQVVTFQNGIAVNGE